jgi:predicted SAM-dependent methyltransferase
VAAARRTRRKFESLEVLETERPLTRAALEEIGVRGLQYGAGDALRRGWLNTDLRTVEDTEGRASEPGLLVRLSPDRYYLQHDALTALPIEDGAFERVYSEHFIEHLTLDQAIAWLREVRRLLRPQGYVRLVTPDLGRYAAGYLDPAEVFFSAHRERLAALPAFRDREMPRRRAFMVNQIFYMWGHRWIYDLEELRFAAAAAGFDADAVEQREFGEGREADVCAFDLEWRRDESLYAEITRT